MAKIKIQKIAERIVTMNVQDKTSRVDKTSILVRVHNKSSQMFAVATVVMKAIVIQTIAILTAKNDLFLMIPYTIKKRI